MIVLMTRVVYHVGLSIVGVWRHHSCLAIHLVWLLRSNLVQLFYLREVALLSAPGVTPDIYLGNHGTIAVSAA